VDLDAPRGSVLALLGENGAGKSTLVKIVAGDYQADAGEIRVGDDSYDSLDPVAARRLGIRIILQELSDAPHLTVAENILLGRWPAERGVVRWERMREAARRELDDLGVDLDVDAPVGTLRIGERQVVEIARALSDDARCLILDEPTAALAAKEVDALFEAIRRLRARGVALIYITHRLDEVERVADRVQVLRDGNTVLVGATSSSKRADLVSAMIGKNVAAIGRPPVRPEDRASRPSLRFRDATRARTFAGVDFAVRPGEVVALYGKVGSGTNGLLEAAFGLTKLDGGSIEIEGHPLARTTPGHAIGAGVGFLPADRQREGLFMPLSVASNLSAPSWKALSKFGVITGRREAKVFWRWRDALRIRGRDDPSQVIATLSGGNQQKVMLGRWLQRDARVLLLVEPTRGVDVGARQDIYKSIRELASRLVAVLIATSDIEEVVQVADRALVMNRGRVVASLDAHQISAERLVAATGD
jgi:ribose transport system ATP-binding protein